MQTRCSQQDLWQDLASENCTAVVRDRWRCGARFQRRKARTRGIHLRLSRTHWSVWLVRKEFTKARCRRAVAQVVTVPAVLSVEAFPTQWYAGHPMHRTQPRATRNERELSSNPRWQAASAGVRPRSPRAGRPMARNCAFGALASSNKNHWLVGWSPILTDVRCRSPAAIVAAHRRSRVPFWTITGRRPEVCAHTQTYARTATDATAAPY